MNPGRFRVWRAIVLGSGRDRGSAVLPRLTAGGPLFGGPFPPR